MFSTELVELNKEMPLMIDGKRIAVVMPAYNAERTLEKTVRGLPGVVDIKILVDDSSKDNTAVLSERLGVLTFVQIGRAHV